MARKGFNRQFDLVSEIIAIVGKRRMYWVVQSLAFRLSWKAVEILQEMVISGNKIK
jgi:hypothetical protein